MSRQPELSEALVKREIERDLRQAGISVKDSKKAVAVFCRYLDTGAGILATDLRSALGKIFTRLKMRLTAG